VPAFKGIANPIHVAEVEVERYRMIWGWARH